jgi:hypothetical protein
MSELSIGGCYVDTRTQFSEGTAITITAMFPGADLVLSGKVLYTQQGYGFGVGFDPLPDTTRQQLEEFLKQAAG